MEHSDGMPRWLDELTGTLAAPKETIEVDPERIEEVIQANNICGSRFDHEDGVASMGVYVAGADPETGEGVGIAIIFLGDDMRMYRRADSIQGVDLEKAQRELLSDYLEVFHRPSASTSPRMGA